MQLLASTKIQINVMKTSKEYRIAMLISFLYASVTFSYNIFEVAAMDISLIKDANQYVCYSPMNGLWYFFSLIYPFLVVMPFSTSYISDYKNQLLPIYISRTSRNNYYISKILASFIGSATIIAIPFCVNLILCNIFFPHNLNSWFGEYQMGNYYRSLLGMNFLYATSNLEMPFLKVYLFSPLLYNIMYLLFFSFFSGMIGALVMSFSFFCKKHKILLYIPIFLVLQFSQVYDSMKWGAAMDNKDVYVNFHILEYVLPLANRGGQSLDVILSVFCGIAVVIVLFTFYALKDEMGSMQ